MENEYDLLVSYTECPECNSMAIGLNEIDEDKPFLECFQCDHNWDIN